MSETTPPPEAEVECANCRRRFVGEYCPDCGQAVEEPRQPVGAIVRDFLGAVFAFDTRFWRTLKPLVLRPGFLTQEYFAGRRARYVPPLRLYVFTAIVFFGVMTVTNGGPFRAVAKSEGGSRVTIGGFAMTEEDPTTEEQVAESRADSIDPADSGLQRWLATRIRRAGERPDEFNASMIDAFSYAHFLTLPLFALVLQLFWRRRYYVEHLVLGVHFHAFALIAGVVLVSAFAAAGLDPDGPAAGMVSTAWVLVLAVYLYRSLRRTYEGRSLVVGLKTIGAGWLYLVVVSIVMAGVAMIAMIGF